MPSVLEHPSSGEVGLRSLLGEGREEARRSTGGEKSRRHLSGLRAKGKARNVPLPKALGVLSKLARVQEQEKKSLRILVDLGCNLGYTSPCR